MIAYLAPVMYALGIWIFINAVVLGDPFAWVTEASSSAPVNAVSSAAPDFNLVDAIGNALRIQLIFPIGLVAIPMLVFGTRDAIGYGIALLIVLNVAWSVTTAAVAGSVDVIELQDALPAMIAGCAGIAWCYLRAESMRALLWAVTVGLALVSLPLAWTQMQTFPHQNLEEAFTRAVFSGEDQEGSTSRGGFQVGIATERAMADYIDDQDIGNNEILTDNARTFGVIILTGQPNLFFDRVDKGDTEWQKVLDDPWGNVDYVLVQRTDADLILQKYPGMDVGEVDGFDPIASNDRYTLISVSPTAPATSGDAATPNTTSQQDTIGG